MIDIDYIITSIVNLFWIIFDWGRSGVNWIVDTFNWLTIQPTATLIVIALLGFIAIIAITSILLFLVLLKKIFRPVTDFISKKIKDFITGVKTLIKNLILFISHATIYLINKTLDFIKWLTFKVALKLTWYISFKLLIKKCVIGTILLPVNIFRPKFVDLGVVDEADEVDIEELIEEKAKKKIVMQRFAKPDSDELKQKSIKTQLIISLGQIGLFFFTKVSVGYYKLYKKKDTFKKYLINTTILLMLLMAVLFFFITPNVTFIKSMIAILLLAILTVRFFKWFHVAVGNKFYCFNRELKAIEFVESKHQPKVAKVFNKSGKGKDSLVTAFMTLLTEFLYKMSLDELEDILSIVHFIDFKKFHNFINDEENAKNYFHASIDFQKNQFKKDLLKIDFWDKDYLKSHFFIPNMKDLIKDWEGYENDLNYNCKHKEFLYGGDLGKRHLLDFFFDYCKEYLRVYYVKDYAGSNQPIIQFKDKDVIRMTKKIGAKALENGQPGEYEVFLDLGNGLKNYLVQDQIQSPIPKKFVISLTEKGLIDNNLNKARQHEIVKNGEHVTWLAIRHLYGERCYIYTIDQTVDREIAVTREQNRHTIYVNQMNIIQTRDTSRIEKEIEVLKRKLRNQSFILFEAILSFFGYSKYKLRLRLRYLTEKLAKLRAKDYLEFDLIISDCGATNADEIYINKILNSDKEFIEPYRLKLMFARNKSHGRYATHVFSGLGEERNKKAKINPFNAKNWDTNLKGFSKEDIIELDQAVINQFAGVTVEDKVIYDKEKGGKTRFKVVKEIKKTSKKKGSN